MPPLASPPLPGRKEMPDAGAQAGQAASPGQGVPPQEGSGAGSANPDGCGTGGRANDLPPSAPTWPAGAQGAGVSNPLDVAIQALQTAGYANPALEAELLASGLAGQPLGEWRTAAWQGRAALPGGFEAAVARRVAGEPSQYITGRAPFRGGELLVGPGVLIPRPETEWLAELAITAARDYRQPVVVDLGTGCGALAWAIATEVPGAKVYAVELSAEAASYARQNLAGLAVELVLGDATSPDLLAELNGQVDLVVANPPYLPAGTVLGPDLVHEPAQALWGGGAAGLDLPRGFLATARRLMAPGEGSDATSTGDQPMPSGRISPGGAGATWRAAPGDQPLPSSRVFPGQRAALTTQGGQVFMEIDPSQAESILVLARQLGFTAGQVHQDLAGRPRVFHARP